MSSRTKTYLVGRRYLIEKKEEGNKTGLPRTPKLGQNVPVSEKERSSKIIADQVSMDERTVRRASEFTLAVDRIVEVTGIKVKHT